MADGKMDERTLNQFLDGLVAGEPAAEPSGGDAEPLDTFRTLRSLARTPPPARAQARLNRDVDAAIDRLARNPAGWRRPMNGFVPGPVRGARQLRLPDRNSTPAHHPVTLPPGSSPAMGGRSAWFVIATVLLVIAIAIGGGYGYEAFGPRFHRHQQPKSIPAASGLASPTAEPAGDGALLRITLPADALPSPNAIEIYSGLALFTIPPGTRSTWHPYCCPGPMIEFVVSGSYTVRAEAAIQVVRADGATIDVPANTGVTLTAGDALVSRNETVVEAANTGTVPVELLNWVLIGDPSFNGHQLPGWVVGNADVQGSLELAAIPMTLELRRITVKPGDRLPTPAAGELRFLTTLPVDAEGTPIPSSIASMSDGGKLVLGTKPLEMYALTAVQTVPRGSPPAGSPTP